jgi:hypothetical protein
MRKGDKYYVIAFVPVVLWLLGIVNMDPQTYLKVVCGAVFVVEVVGFAWMGFKDLYSKAVDTANMCNSDNTD